MAKEMIEAVLPSSSTFLGNHVGQFPLATEFINPA
jgi:hypothetical protein